MGDYEGRPGTDEFAPFYASYVARVPPGGLAGLLGRQVNDTTRLLTDRADGLEDHSYAPGKWTVKEVVGHLADSERVFSTRILRIARGDTTPLPGFNEQDYVPAGAFGVRSLESILEELMAARRATVHLLEGLPAAAWERRGVASDKEVSVRALACIIAGHELHHREILQQRYLPS